MSTSDPRKYSVRTLDLDAIKSNLENVPGGNGADDPSTLFDLADTEVMTTQLVQVVMRFCNDPTQCGFVFAMAYALTGSSLIDVLLKCMLSSDEYDKAMAQIVELGDAGVSVSSNAILINPNATA